MTQATLNDKVWLIRDVLKFASDDFAKRQFEAPRLEAELLLGFELGLTRVQLLLDGGRPLSKEELGRYRALIARRRTGEPIAYILGQREFYGRTFHVDPRVLIPRPDTEILVDVALARTRKRNLSARVLDLCTGSGCVAITIAKERPTWQVTGIDVSLASIEVARDNALNLGAIWGVRFLDGDLFSPLEPRERFELILSNPPYIPTAELPKLMRDVRDFEPHLALDGGDDGLHFYRQIAHEALGYLSSGGVLAVEIGADQGSDVVALFAQAGYSDVEIQKDYGSRDRVVSAKAPLRT